MAPILNQTSCVCRDLKTYKENVLDYAHNKLQTKNSKKVIDTNQKASILS
jgi:hypothetical protein